MDKCCNNCESLTQSGPFSCRMSITGMKDQSFFSCSIFKRRKEPPQLPEKITPLMDTVYNTPLGGMVTNVQRKFNQLIDYLEHQKA